MHRSENRSRLKAKPAQPGDLADQNAINTSWKGKKLLFPHQPNSSFAFTAHLALSALLYPISSV